MRDLMLAAPGVYHCNNWCGGYANIRGNFCRKCAWDEAYTMMCMGSGDRIDWDLFRCEVLGLCTTA